MTLILTFSCHFFAVTVSDRLVTAGRRPFDLNANKAIVCITGDSATTIGFTGVAYIGGLPTDEWLARQIVGEGYTNLLVTSKTLHLPREHRQVVNRLVVGLKRELEHNHGLQKGYLEIGIGGTLVRHSIFWPYQLILQKPTRSKHLGFVSLYTEDRDWGKSSIWVSGGWGLARPRLYDELAAALSDVDVYQSGDAVEHVVEVLLTSLSKYASTDGTIGRNALVTAHHFGRRETRVEFRPIGATPPHALMDQIGIKSSPLYSPWIVAGHSVMPPAAIVGDYTLRLGGPYEVHLKGGDPDAAAPRGTHYFSLQRRRYLSI